MQDITRVWKGPSSDSPVFGRVWYIHAPWAHLAWQQYAVLLYDLTGEHKDGPAKILKEGCTHEMMVWCIDPQHNIAFDYPEPQPRFLQPANMGYQFPAKDHADAEQRIQALVDRVERGTLSPDTDFRRLWNAEFRDGYSLVTSAISGD